MRDSERRKVNICFFLLIVAFVGIEYYTINFFYKRFVFHENGKLIAKVNDIRIYENDIKLRLNSLEEEMNDDLKKAILYEAYLDKYFLLKYKKDIFDKEEIDMIVNDMKKKIIKNKFLEKNVLEKITEADLKKKYEKNVEYIKQKEERKISHILVEREEEAERIRKNILRFDNFEYQAEKYSLDKISAIKGGDLGYLLKTEISLPEFADIAFLLNKGEISKPVKTEKGWHLIKVEDIRNVEIKDFDEIKDVLQMQLENELVSNYLNKILSNAEIKIINDSIFNTINNNKNEK